MTRAVLDDVNVLDDVAKAVINGRRGGVLQTFALAWILADLEDKRIMWAAWIDLILKYDLYLGRPTCPAG